MIRDVMTSKLPEETKVQLIAGLVRAPTTSTPKKEEGDDDCARAQKPIAQRIGTCDKMQVSNEVVNVINGGHMPEGDLQRFVGNMLTANDPVGIRVVALLRHLKADQEYIPGGEANEMLLGKAAFQGALVVTAPITRKRTQFRLVSLIQKLKVSPLEVADEGAGINKAPDGRE